MNQLVTTQEILIILAPAIGLAIVALVLAATLSAYDRYQSRADRQRMINEAVARAKRSPTPSDNGS